MAQRGARRRKFDVVGSDGVDGRPIPPAWLKGRGLEIWREVLPHLPWLGPLDSYALAEWSYAQSELEAGGRTEWSATRLVEHRRSGVELGIGAPQARTKMPAGGPRRPTARAPETKAERLEREAEQWWAENTPGG